jgi:hypothetical protein
MWPDCDVSHTTFCVESFTIDGVSYLGSSDWRVDAELLDANSVNWAVQEWNGSTWIEAQDIQAQMAFKLNVGNVKPLFTYAFADRLSLTPGGDATNGYTLEIEGSPVTLEWKDSTVGGNCDLGECGDNTTQADSETWAFSGNTQNMSTWQPDEKARFAGMYSGSDAQYRSEPTFSNVPSPSWSLDLGNPHLSVSAQPVIGTYSAFVPKALLDSVGATAAEAAAAGLIVKRSDGGTTTTVGAAVMPTADGGVYMRIPHVHYSTPTFKVKGVGGHKLVLAPDAPRSFTATPLNGGAVLRFRRPYFDGGGRITHYVVNCAALTTQVGTSTAAVAIEVDNLPNDEATNCIVWAANAQKKGRISYVAKVTPAADALDIPPGATPSIHVAQRDNGDVVLSWAHPSSSGGSTILDYKVNLCLASRSCPSHSLASKVTTQRSVRFKAGLFKFRKYQVVVRARNAVGLGDPARKAFKHH